MSVAQKHSFGDSAIIVARVSTPQQQDSPQLKDLHNYAIKLGFKNIKQFGTTESGFLELDDKQGWNLVVDFFENNPSYRTLIVTELSRLSRVKSTLMIIEEYLIKNKIQLIVKDINFYLFNDYGIVTAGADMIFTLFASFASSEMSNKKERFTRALKEYRQRGYSIGGKELFGYTREYVKIDGRNKPLSRYIINEKEKKEILKIYNWYAFGIDGDISKTSVRRITERCIEEGMSKYLHSARNVSKCLKEKAYTGYKETHNRIKNPEYWNYHKYDKPKYIYAEKYLCIYPQIFENENTFLFDYVQSRLTENNSKIRDGVKIIKERKHTTILSRLITCPCCGKYLHGEYAAKKGIQQFMYRCAGARGKVNKCSFNSTLSMQMYDSIIWEFCKNDVRRIRIDDLRKKSDESTKEIQQKILNLQSMIDEYDGRFDTEDTIFRMNMLRSETQEAREDLKKKYEKKITTLTNEKKSLIKRQSTLKDELSVVNKSQNIIYQLKKQPLDESNKEKISQYIHKIIKTIEIIYTDKEYTILKINYYTYNNDIDYSYMCIYKRNRFNIEIVQIYDNIFGVSKENPLTWDKTTLRQGNDTLTIQDLYDICHKTYSGEKKLKMNFFTKPIKYNKLQCYDDDVRERIDLKQKDL